MSYGPCTDVMLSISTLENYCRNFKVLTNSFFFFFRFCHGKKVFQKCASISKLKTLFSHRYFHLVWNNYSLVCKKNLSYRLGQRLHCSCSLTLTPFNLFVNTLSITRKFQPSTIFFHAIFSYHDLFSCTITFDLKVEKRGETTYFANYHFYWLQNIDVLAERLL